MNIKGTLIVDAGAGVQTLMVPHIYYSQYLEGVQTLIITVLRRDSPQQDAGYYGVFLEAGAGVQTLQVLHIYYAEYWGGVVDAGEGFQT